MEFAKLVISRDRGASREVVVGKLTNIGRAPTNSLVLDDPRVSRHHAVLRVREQDIYVLSDLGSSNGSFVNGRRVLVPERVFHEDVLSVGGYSLTFMHQPSRRPPAVDPDTEGTSIAAIPRNPVTVVGTGPAMEAVFALMRRAAASTIPVLLEGETGTGKELVARAIHAVSDRSKRHFLGINCAALPESLLESQLFGHRRGAFTGADRDRIGIFEAASGGTIFLDEIGEMPLDMQVKLLRVLQEGEVTPLGDTLPRPVNARVMAATNRDLQHAVGAGTFRQDLYYRLAAFPIVLPPLRERIEDVPVLAEGFLVAAAHHHRKRVHEIDAEALFCLQAYSWPGNVRELHNEIQRAVVLADDNDRLSRHHLSPHIARAIAAPAAAVVGPSGTDDLRTARAAFEAHHIAQVLEREGGNVSRAAEVLGLSRMQLHRKLKEYRLR